MALDTPCLAHGVSGLQEKTCLSVGMFRLNTRYDPTPRRSRSDEVSEKWHGGDTRACVCRMIRASMINSWL
jgi:hypothetical protein